jgi:hypothetical protein
MRVVARLGAIGIAIAALYWLTANAWFFFSWVPTMAQFEPEPLPSLVEQGLMFLVYGCLPAILALVVCVWIWRATRKPGRRFSAKPS